VRGGRDSNELVEYTNCTLQAERGASPSEVGQFSPSVSSVDREATQRATSSGELLELAILEASKAGQWAAVATLAKELEARRLSVVVGESSNVVPFGAKRGGK
jgi:hypothetical protein